MPAITDHDSYLASVPEQFRPVLNDLREQLSRLLPDAQEIVAYSMPGFTLDGVVVASYAAFSRRAGLYLHRGALADHAEEITAAGFTATKTGITFPADRPLPKDLVERLVESSRRHAAA